MAKPNKVLGCQGEIRQARMPGKESTIDMASEENQLGARAKREAAAGNEPFGDSAHKRSGLLTL